MAYIYSLNHICKAFIIIIVLRINANINKNLDIA